MKIKMENMTICPRTRLEKMQKVIQNFDLQNKWKSGSEKCKNKKILSQQKVGYKDWWNGVFWA